MGIILMFLTWCSMLAVIAHLLFSGVAYAALGLKMTFLSWFFLIVSSMLYEALKGRDDE